MVSFKSLLTIKWGSSFILLWGWENEPVISNLANPILCLVGVLDLVHALELWMQLHEAGVSPEEAGKAPNSGSPLLTTQVIYSTDLRVGF